MPANHNPKTLRFQFVFQARLHIGALEFWILLQNVLDGIASSEKFQDSLHRDARTANYWPPVANIRFD